MDKSLRSLTRLNEWRVDQCRLALAERMRVLDELERRARKLEDDLRAEQRAAAETPAVAGFAYGAYARRAIARRAELRRAIGEAEAAVAAAREAVRAAYHEQKKIEITARTRALREKRERDRQDQIVLDEVAQMAFLRRNAAS